MSYYLVISRAVESEPFGIHIGFDDREDAQFEVESEREENGDANAMLLVLPDGEQKTLDDYVNRENAKQGFPFVVSAYDEDGLHYRVNCDFCNGIGIEDAARYSLEIALSIIAVEKELNAKRAPDMQWQKLRTFAVSR